MAKNRKYILGSGIAVSPEKDMALFKKMSGQGWHMSGTMLWWYRFERGEPADYDYASHMEGRVTKEMLSLYEEGGWHPIVAVNGLQIFRARAGATPIFSDAASEIDALEEIRRGAVKRSIIIGAIFLPIAAAYFFVPDLGAWRLVFLVLYLLFLYPFVEGVVSILGISRIIRKKRKQATP